MAEHNDTLPTGGHGGAGSQPIAITRLIDHGYVPLRLRTPDTTLGIVAGAMDPGPDPGDGTDPKDEVDPQENPRIPAAYTYFGQFIDHDLTFDTVSSLDTGPSKPNNERTPRLDLDCVYGLGIDSAPYMYDTDTGALLTNPNGFDLPRAGNHRAIIGDPRNDENSIVCQVQRGFIKFHNAVVKRLIDTGKAKPGKDAFEAARREVRLTYQAVVIHDYLVRIVADDVALAFENDRRRLGDGAFKLYPRAKWATLPIEFTVAAYRYGHSMIRNAYRMNTGQAHPQHIFEGEADGKDSLVGFGTLDESHDVDWRLFLPAPSAATAPGQVMANDDDSKGRMQFAYKIDTSVVRPIAVLPSRIVGAAVLSPFAALAARNLKRAYNFDTPSGQDVAHALGINPLSGGDLAIRMKGGFKTFGELGIIDPADVRALVEATPLWLYVLMEAQSTINRDIDFEDDKHKLEPTALGPVGGRILLEVFHGILLNDEESLLHAHNWRPMARPDGDQSRLTLWDIFVFAGEIR